MTLRIRQGGRCLAALGALLVLAGTCQAQGKVDLTGHWRYADGSGACWARQIGSEVWWVGRSADGGKKWTHVFHGRIKGEQLVGTWADVPAGQLRNNGTLRLNFVLEGGTAVRMSGRFGDEDVTLERVRVKKK